MATGGGEALVAASSGTWIRKKLAWSMASKFGQPLVTRLYHRIFVFQTSNKWNCDWFYPLVIKVGYGKWLMYR